jgi:hypothetical protein
MCYKKPFVITQNILYKDPNHKIHYAYNQIEAIEFAKKYYGEHDVYAESVDNYKASFILKLEEVK